MILYDAMDNPQTNKKVQKGSKGTAHNSAWCIMMLHLQKTRPAASFVHTHGNKNTCEISSQKNQGAVQPLDQAVTAAR